MHLLDLIQNALEAGASALDIEIIENIAENRLIMSVSDNGPGMDKETVERLEDPFFTTRQTRDVGLGIPLLEAAARRCNGDLKVTSSPDNGTKVVAEFEHDHIDRAPMGNLKSTLLGSLLSAPECDLCYTHRVNDREFTLDSREIRESLDPVPLTHPRVRAWLDELLDRGFASLYGEPEEETDAKTKLR